MKTVFEQFVTVKQEYNEENLIALMRQGDFYITYQQDAIDVAEICGIVIVRTPIDKEYIEKIGFQYQYLDTYLPKLVRAGKRVAICETINY